MPVRQARPNKLLELGSEAFRLAWLHAHADAHHPLAVRRSEGHLRGRAWSGWGYELRVRIKNRGNDPEAEISSPVRGLVAKLHHVIIRPAVAGTLFFGIEN